MAEDQNWQIAWRIEANVGHRSGGHASIWLPLGNWDTAGSGQGPQPKR